MSSESQPVAEPMEVEESKTSQPAEAVPSSQPTKNTEMMETGVPSDAADDELTEQLRKYISSSLEKELTKRHNNADELREQVLAREAGNSNPSSSEPVIQEENKDEKPQPKNEAKFSSNLEVIEATNTCKTKLHRVQHTLEKKTSDTYKAEEKAIMVEQNQELSKQLATIGNLLINIHDLAAAKSTVTKPIVSCSIEAPVVCDSSSSAPTTSPAASEAISEQNSGTKHLEQETVDPTPVEPATQQQDSQQQHPIIENDTNNTPLAVVQDPSTNDDLSSFATETVLTASPEHGRFLPIQSEDAGELHLPLAQENQSQDNAQESEQIEDIADASPVVVVFNSSSFSEPSETSQVMSSKNGEIDSRQSDTGNQDSLTSTQQEPEVIDNVSAAPLIAVRETVNSQEVVEEEFEQLESSGNNDQTLPLNAEQQHFHHDDDFTLDPAHVLSDSEVEPESDGEGPSTKHSTVKTVPQRIAPERGAKTRAVELQAKTNAGRKRSAAPKETPAKRQKLPIFWHTLACFKSRQFLNFDSLTDVQFKSQLHQIFQPTEETNLSDIISYRDDKSYKETEKTLGKLFDQLEFQKLLFRAEKEISENARRMEEKKLTTALLLGEQPKCKVPFLLYTFGFKEGVVVGKNGKAIVEKASEFEIGENVNHVYNSEKFTYVTKDIGPEFPPTNFFALRGFEDSEDEGTSSAQSKHQEPVVELNIDDDDLERKATVTSVCLIRDAGKKIATDIFLPGNLEKICDSKDVVVLRQIGQHSTQNEQPGQQKSNFHVGTIYEERKVGTFFGNLRKVMKVSKNCVDKCVSKGLISEIDLRELQEELKGTELKCKDIKQEILPLIICFGSNIDIDDNKDEKEKNEDKKKKKKKDNEKEEEALKKALQDLPAWARPREGLMAILKDKLPGINRIQVYVKGPGCRTTAHYENEGIGSINVNLGPDDCVWFTISMKHSAKLEALLCKKKVAPCHDPIWLDEEDLRAAGIPYSKFLQKPNDMVFVNTGTYHWVQSNGFCTNVSWNILLEDKTQLAAAALFNDYNATHSYANALPIEKLLWSIAKEKKYPKSEISKLTKCLLTCSLAHITMEQKSAEKEGWIFKDGKDFPELLENVNICSEKECHRRSLFNLIFLKPGKQFLEPLCYNCVKVEDKDITTCYRMNTLEELVDIFDSYE